MDRAVLYQDARARTVARITGRTLANDTRSAIWTPDPRNAPQCLAYELAKSGAVMEIGFGGSAGGGKALSIYGIIPTPNGYKQMGDLLVGDEVFGMDGCVYRITATSEIMYDHRVFDVVFDDGVVIRADAEHKWLTFTANDRDQLLRSTDEWRAKRRASRPSRGTGKRPDLAISNARAALDYIPSPVTGSVRTTIEIKNTLFVGNTKRSNHSIPIASPLDLPDRSLPIDPYILGFWIGDGGSWYGRLTIGDRYIKESARLFEEAGYPIRALPSCKYEYTAKNLHKALRLGGFLRNKHIPDDYLFASFNQRRALLQGLMDTDGYASKSGQCEFYSSKETLIKSVSRLLHTLGIKHAIRTKKPPKNTAYNPSFRIKFVAPFPVFRLSEKLSRQNMTLRDTQKWRYIVDVREVGSEPVKCIAINSPDHLYLAGEECVPTHNTDTMLGIAATLFHNSRLMRREFPQLDGIITRGDQIFPDHFVGGIKKQWRYDSRTIALRSMQYEDDWKKYQGQAIEFLGIDEAAEFSEKGVRSLTGWLRSATGQRTLIMYGFNPPTSPEGEWIIRYFAPWIDVQYPNPAGSGEVRWMANLPVDGATEKIIEVPTGDPFVDEASGQTIYPISRTFIKASRRDNPYLGEEYERRLQNLPEPLRTIIRDGDFTVSVSDDPWQVVPTNWVLEAQARWRETEKPDVALRAIGVDVAHGGADNTVIARLFGTWFDNLLIYPGATTPDGDSVAKHVEDVWDGSARIGVDAIGYGASASDTMAAWGMHPMPINFGAASKRTDKSHRFQFFNQRAECYWALRDALDPTSGEDICLPPSRTLRADLCAPRYKIVRGKIQLEEKIHIKERLNRSPDEGDCVVLAWRSAQSLGVPRSLDW